VIVRSRVTRALGSLGAKHASLRIHFGRIASADTVMKSGGDRDNIVKREKVLGFEMEGAGILNSLPCIVVKGVSDYADSPKDKIWQSNAAGTAAACAKALLEQWTITDRSSPAAASIVDGMRPNNCHLSQLLRRCCCPL
jgi:nucleoside phosphorylase